MAKNKKTDETAGNGVHLTISAPNFAVAEFPIRGTSPYVQNKFSKKARDKMREDQEAGSKRKKGTKREGKNFKQVCEDAKHLSDKGWCGIPASAFRAAMISACRMCGFKMTHAKLSVFVKEDGYDADEPTPLVRITKGEPEYTEMPVRLESGVIDIHPRPMWRPGWEAIVRVRYDADQFSSDDIANLLMRVGMQVGVGEGRPDSKKSAGMGWGLFELISENGKS